MKNLKMTVKGNILTVTCDLSKSQGPSKSGNSEIFGSTLGNVDVPGKPEYKIGVNIYKPNN
jgi:hypothetical protein